MSENRESLSRHRSIATDDLWQYTRRLLDSVTSSFEKESVADDCLDVVVNLLGADRGVIVLFDAEGGSEVIHARGARGRLEHPEREEISRSLVRQAFETRNCIVWDQAESASVTTSFATLGLRAALAAPLHIASAREQRGVLYVDFRDPRTFLGEQQISFFMWAAVLLAAVLEQHRLGKRTQSHLLEAHSHFVESKRSPAISELLGMPGMQGLRSEVAAALRSAAPVLILGESGTGKTALAQAIAEATERRPIVRAVLGGSDDLNTISSELFGHEKGAFTGAINKRVGLVEYANGGTLILDEVLSLPPHAQQILLDFTQFGTYAPLGYHKQTPKKADVRVIAATNGDLGAAMRDGRFREDLFYRLAGAVLQIPPLRERRGDIPSLVEAKLRSLDPGRSWKLTSDAVALLTSEEFDWPGNVRQLEWSVGRARDRAMAKDPDCSLLDAAHLGSGVGHGLMLLQAARPSAPVPSGAPADQWLSLQRERERLVDKERALIDRILGQADGVVADAARTLGIPRTTLANKMEALGLKRR